MTRPLPVVPPRAKVRAIAMLVAVTLEVAVVLLAIGVVIAIGVIIGVVVVPIIIGHRRHARPEQQSGCGEDENGFSCSNPFTDADHGAPPLRA
ncbi:MAG: hypothetical protein IIA00_00515 [Proteobacteria bacterium]|nr:hypothetical protein [Pseudomonadota bacterium]